MRTSFLSLFLLACTIFPAHAQESPYFVTYDHHLEEPGNLEISVANTGGLARADQRTYFAPYIELEYGTKTWWTSELYLEWQSTLGDSAIFTGACLLLLDMWRSRERKSQPALDS